jgi:type IV pilus assembly protein PilW
LHLLVRDIRGAGFSGCAGIEPTIINILANNPPPGMSAFTGEEVVWGLNDVSSGNAYNAFPGTDVIRVRGAGDGVAGLVGNTVPVNANIQTTKINTLFKASDILMITDCEATDIFRATSVSNGSGKTTVAHSNSQNTSNFLSRPYGKDAFLLKFRSNAYFVRDSGRTNSVGQPILSLFWRDETVITGPVDTELVDGVEDMQVTYGVDTDGNGFVDRFMDASAVQAGNLWPDVLGVQIALLMSSVDNASNAPVPYTYAGATSTPVAPDLRLRQEMVSTVTIRNRVD